MYILELIGALEPGPPARVPPTALGPEPVAPPPPTIRPEPHPPEGANRQARDADELPPPDSRSAATREERPKPEALKRGRLGRLVHRGD